MRRTYYDELGVAPDDPPDRIQDAYFALAQRYHPDVNRSPDANARMARINVAYETLSDPQRRRRYDIEIGLHEAASVKAHQVTEPAPSPPPRQAYKPRQERAAKQEPYLGLSARLLNAGFLVCVWGAIMAVATWLLAFGGIETITGSIERAQVSSSPPWLTITSPHQHAADSAVLTLGDLPPGWTASPEDDSDDSGDAIDLPVSEECEQVKGPESFDGALARSSTEDMKGPDRQSINSEAYVFATSEAAQQALDKQRAGFSQCGADFIALINAVFQHSLEDEGITPDQVHVETVLEDLGSPNVGEAGLMFRLRSTVTGPRGSVELTVDFMSFRHGRMVSELDYASFGGLRLEEEQQLAQIAAAKLQDASASLREA